MKKIFSIILALVIMLSSVSALAYDIVFFKLVENANLLLPETNLVVENGNCIFEAEDLTLGDDVKVVRESDASGGMAVTTSGVSYQSDEKQIKDSTIAIKITIPKYEHGAYKLWARFKDDSSYEGFSIFRKFYGTSNKFASHRITKPKTGEYFWTIIGWYTVTGTEKNDVTFTFDIKYLDTGWKIDKFLLCMDDKIFPEDIDGRPTWLSGVESGISYPKPAVMPPEDVHPKVLATKDIIPQLKENAQHPALKPMYDRVYKYANETLTARLPAGKNNVNLTTLFKIQSRAYIYLLGNANEAHAKQTVRYMRDTFETLEWNRGTGDITRRMGAVISTAACVYDWCYDVLTEEDKSILIRDIKYLASLMEIGYPTTTHETFQGHGGEGDALYYQLVAAIAIYDEDPEMYDYVAGMLFDVSYETRKYFNSTGNHPSGNDYGPVRGMWEALSAVVIDRLGVDYDPDDVMGDEVDKIPMKFLYAKLPNGKTMKDGDTFTFWDYNVGPVYDYNDYPMMLYGQYYNNNKYLRAEYMKQLSLKNYAPGIELYNNGILTLLTLNPGDGILYPWEGEEGGEALPLSYSTTYPMTSLYSRTSWKNGINSDTAVVFMNGQEKIAGDHDHDHADLGHFSIYYKGNLTDQAGIYDKYSSPHYMNFYRRSISHNCMTVYDPNEKFTRVGKESPVWANDGGQKWEPNSDFLHEYLSHPDEAATEGIYTGPDKMAPEFSYLKTNITNAYSDKVAGYTRSMVSINLFNSDYPLAFVCYDNISSSDATFRKAWNLQAYKEPAISGTQTVITRDDYDFSGKLVVNTMLPENAKITKVGGEGYESYVDGKNYAAGDEPMNYEQHSWRIEVSPAEAANDDIFLNAMYVTDTDKDLPDLPMFKEDMEKHLGVTVMDKTVLFSKTRNAVSESFTIDVRDNGYSMMSVLVTDVARGKWKVTGNGTELVVESKKDNREIANATDNPDENAIYLRLAPGRYTLTKVADDTETTAFEYPINRDGFKVGDFLMYNTGKKLFMNNVESTLIKDDILYLSEDDFEAFGVTVTNNNGNITLQRDKYVGTLALNSTQGTYRGEPITLLAPPFVNEDGILYISILEQSKILGYTMSYDPLPRVLKMTKIASAKDINLMSVDDDKVKLPIAISASNHDGNVPENVLDFNFKSRWSAQGTNEWLTLDYGEVIDIDKIYLAFYCGDERSTIFDVEVSNDGNVYQKVFEGQASGDTLEAQEFAINAKGKYMRINFHGNTNGELWNSVTELVTLTK